MKLIVDPVSYEPLLVEIAVENLPNPDQDGIPESNALPSLTRNSLAPERPESRMTIGQQIADQVAKVMGSWKFIIAQTAILIAWIMLNVTAYVQKWDPYPFILLNLGLSFQAAYAAPFIMMSQNRQQDIDRKEAETDYKVNIKAELEIELLHQKIDELRQKELMVLTQAVSDLTSLLKASRPPSQG